MRTIIVDNNLQEPLQYADDSFPIELTIDHLDHFSNYTLPSHWHSCFEYASVIEGSVEATIGGTIHRLNPYDCAFINSGVIHSYKAATVSEHARIFVVCFSPSALAGNMKQTIYQKYFSQFLSRPFDGFSLSRMNPDSSQLFEMLDNLYKLHAKHHDDYGYELCCLSLLSNLWLQTLLYMKSNPQTAAVFHPSVKSRGQLDTVKKILSYIHSNYMHKISVKTISDELYLSRSTIFRCFKFYTNSTPADYINDYRLYKAQKLLVDTNCSISEIALNCGFFSDSYFIKCYKDKFDISPSRYRKTNVKISEVN